MNDVIKYEIIESKIIDLKGKTKTIDAKKRRDNL